MFSLHDFIMKTLYGMVGRYPDFQVREYALNWYGKGKLNEEDLATVEEWLTPAAEEPAAEEPAVEEPGSEEETEEPVEAAEAAEQGEDQEPAEEKTPEAEEE